MVERAENVHISQRIKKHRYARCLLLYNPPLYNSLLFLHHIYYYTFFFYFYLHLLLRHLFPGHKFLFLQFLLGYLFLLCSLLFWFRSNLFFFSKDHLSVAGRAHGGVDPTVSSVSPASHLGGLVHLDVLNDQRIYI